MLIYCLQMIVPRDCLPSSCFTTAEKMVGYFYENYALLVPKLTDRWSQKIAGPEALSGSIALGTEPLVLYCGTDPTRMLYCTAVV